MPDQLYGLLMQPCMSCSKVSVLYPEGFYTGYCAWCLASADRGYVLEALSSARWRRDYPVFHREWRQLGYGSDRQCEDVTPREYRCTDYASEGQFCWTHSAVKCRVLVSPEQQCSADREPSGYCAEHFEQRAEEFLRGW